MEHKIEIIGTIPKPSAIYKLSPLEDKTLKEHLSKAFKKNLIRVSKSPFGAAVFFVHKKNGSLRLVTDYQALIAVTVKNQYPLLLISEFLDQLGGSTIFFKIDLTARYNQVQIANKDIPKTAFRTKYGAYKTVVMNFGMTNTPSTFVTLMNNIFKPLLGKCVITYLDNIICVQQN